VERETHRPDWRVAEERRERKREKERREEKRREAVAREYFCVFFLSPAIV